jgi:hypothetical protein
MGKRKRRRQAKPGAAALSPKRLEELLLASSFPRLQMALILALAAVGAFLTSATLVALGVGTMGVRYALAVVGGYLFFLSFVRLWIAYQTRNWSFGRREPGSRQTLDAASTDLPDLSALGGFGGGGGDGFSGGGGAFGGAGASGSFGDSSPTEDTSGVLDGVGSADGDGVVILIAVVALLGGVLALGFVVYSSPLLLAEVLLDFAVVGAIYRKNQRHERRHWAAGVLRRTYKPALVLAVFAAIFGFAVQSLAPTEHTFGAVLKAYESEKK